MRSAVRGWDAGCGVSGVRGGFSGAGTHASPKYVTRHEGQGGPPRPTLTCGKVTRLPVPEMFVVQAGSQRRQILYPPMAHTKGQRP